MVRQQQRQWKGKTGGGNFGQKSLFRMFKVLNVRVGYFFVALTIPFYMLIGRKGYHASFSFFYERLKQPKGKAFRSVMLNYYRFGQVIMDRFALLAKQRNLFDIEFVGGEAFDNLLMQDQGFVMVSSHVGNFELSGYTLKQDRKKIYSMYYAGETETVRHMRNEQMKKSNVEMVPVEEDLSHLFKINNALSEGNIVSMPADRNLGSAKAVTCSFLGKEANFPLGPFILAAIHNVPVLALFVMKTSSNSYRLFIKQVSGEDNNEQTGKVRAEQSLRNFVKELEAIVRKYPEQWFNFYNFWQHSYN